VGFVVVKVAMGRGPSEQKPIALLQQPRGGPGLSPCQVGFMVVKVAMGQVFSEYLCFSANSHSSDCSTLTIIYHLELEQEANGGRSNKWTQSHPTKKKNTATATES
jgi:hypothetical protein